MKLLQLNTGLFPAAQTVDAALRLMAKTQNVEVVELRQRELREEDWDAVMQKILAADQVMTT